MTLLIIGGIIFLIIIFFKIKYIIWDKPHEEINQLKKEIPKLKRLHKNEISQLDNKHQEEINQFKKDIEKLQSLHKEEISQLENDIQKLQSLHKEEISQLKIRLENSDSFKVQEGEFNDIIISFAWQELLELNNKELSFLGIPQIYYHYIGKKDDTVYEIKERFREAFTGQYKFHYLLYLYPELSEAFDGINISTAPTELPDSISTRSENLFEVVNLLRKSGRRADELIYWKNRVSFLEASKSNLTAIPYMAAIMADYETYGIEHLASELDWGYAARRMDKVKAIRAIRKDAQAIVEKNKESQYQLAYLLNLFPNLKDVIDEEFSQLPVIEVSEISDYDSARDYLSKEEYAELSETERNQLALDRYKKSRSRTKWQIGRDYELYVGYKYTQKGYHVDYFGSYMGLEDLGRDLIAKKGDMTLIIQCKYWSAKKQIHENHINQLYGTMVCYCIEHQLTKTEVQGVLVTNIELSSMAQKMAAYLGIECVEHYEVGDFPCIKCNIGHGEHGEITKIYHLPFDQQYDSAKIDKKGEFYAVTVAEAEAAGFRRAFKWFGSN